MTVSLETSNLLASPLLNVGDLLANCAMFRTLMGAATVNAAKAKQFYIETDEDVEGESAFPRCIIGYCPYEFGSELNGTTTWSTKGPVEARLEVPTPSEHTTKQDEVKWWMNSLGTLFDQVRTLATSGTGYLNVVNLKLGMCGPLDKVEYNGVRGMGADLVFEWRGP